MITRPKSFGQQIAQDILDRAVARVVAFGTASDALESPVRDAKCKAKRDIQFSFKRATDAIRLSQAVPDTEAAIEVSRFRSWVVECATWSALNLEGFEFDDPACTCYGENLKAAIEERIAAAQVGMFEGD